MIGAIIGAVCVIGALKVARRAVWHRRGHGWAGGGCSPRFGGGGALGSRRGGIMRWLFERLETTPGQERVIGDAVMQLRKEQVAIREEIGLTRADLARAVEGGIVDEAALEETFARHDRLLAQLRVGWVEALKTVCETLEPRQRKEVADVLARRGFFGGPWGLGRGGGVWA
jgi:Spy/CpxP family protein refolding chaperone